MKFFCIFIMFLSELCLAQWKDVLQLKSPNLTFQVRVRGHTPHFGGCRSELKYLLNSQELPNFIFELYYKNLLSFLEPDLKHTKDLGLKLAISGVPLPGGQYEQGPTLYLDPERFSASEFQGLFELLKREQESVRSSFKNFSAEESFLLGLSKCKIELGIHGIARLIYAKSPLYAIYAANSDTLLLSTAGEVFYFANYSGKSPQKLEKIGAVDFKNKKIILQTEILSQHSLKGEFLKEYVHASGRTLKQDWDLIF